MLESPAIDLSITASIATVKRYAPPISGIAHLVGENPEESIFADNLERANGNSNDGEKNQISASRSTSTLDDAGGRYQANDSHRTGSIPLQGCSGSDAFQLLNNRTDENVNKVFYAFLSWMAALNAYNNLPYDSPERPVMYTKKSPWGHAMVPHQLMSQAGGASSSGLQKDFLSELQLAMHGTSVSSTS